MGFPGGVSGEESDCQSRRCKIHRFDPQAKNIPTGVGNGSPFQYSHLENPMDRGTWWDIVHGVAKSQIQLNTHTHTHTHTQIHFVFWWVFFFFWAIALFIYMPRSRIAGSYDNSTFSFFEEPPYCLPQWLDQFTFPPTVQNGSLFSTPPPAFVICRYFNAGHSDQYEVAPHCSFDLHFSNK